MSIASLRPSVRCVPSFAKEVARSIEQHGLSNPVIVVRGPREDLLRQLEERGDPDWLPKGEVLNIVFGGANRVLAARRLGYTHIDCVLIPTFALAIQVQQLQRESYDGATAKKVGQ